MIHKKKSNRELKAEHIRKANSGRLYHGWSVWQMSNNMVHRLANYGLLRK